MSFFIDFLSSIKLNVLQSFLKGEGFFSQNLINFIFYIIYYSFCALIMISLMSFMAIIGTYLERRIAGFIQSRYGPNRVGFFGLLQPFADGIKLLFKEDIVPNKANKLFHVLSPIIVFIGALFPFVVIPFSDSLKVSSISLSLIYILAFESIEVIGLLMAGYASNNKYSIMGSFRAVSQMLSYEIPLGICAVSVILLSGTMDLNKIILWQSDGYILGWSIFKSPFLFILSFIFFMCGLASSKRAPFDIPEAESELVSGFHTEYSSMKFAFFFMAEYASMFVISAFCVILFLGGYEGGPIPSLDLLKDVNTPLVKDVFFQSNTLYEFLQNLFSKNNFLFLLKQIIQVFNFFFKTFLLYFTIIWIRWTFPRVRTDSLTHLCLKVFLPISLICLMGIVLQVVF